jgi:Transglutaminase-like enzymes, putative cysteine proteases
MELIPDSEISYFLEETEIIDFSNPKICSLSEKLNREAADKTDLMKRIYEFVRDEISHSNDSGDMEVTLKASDVLEKGHGICFAKSHLMAALLRQNGIPVGFCYQKLVLSEKNPILIFHGLCGVYIEETDVWVRLDPRGNKEGVDAQFSIEPDNEKPAFIACPEHGEEDFKTIYAEPAAEIIFALTEYKTREELWKNLPTKINGKSSEIEENSGNGWKNVCERC